MRRIGSQVSLGLGLVALSALTYVIHYAIFHDVRLALSWFMGDLAFIPLQVLLVTMIISRALTEQGRRSMLEKLNLVIGAFFSEVGTALLKQVATFDPHADDIQRDLAMPSAWSDEEFRRASRRIKGHERVIDIRRGDLEALRYFLVSKRGFLLGLLQNANLMEHESFSELLWGVFHLTEELAIRTELRQLSDTERHHLSNDIRRAYTSLIAQWLDYVRHLRDEYPFLFSLALRMNPFDPKASPEVLPDTELRG